VLNDPVNLLSIVLRGALGRSGRKRARRAARFLTGQGGFLTASTLVAAAGVAWGIYDSMTAGASGASGVTGAAGAAPMGPQVPPVLQVPGTASVATAGASLPDEVLRLIRIAVSAARADGDLAPQEREAILARAREAGVGAVVESELAAARPLAEICRGLQNPQHKADLYVLAFAIVRADETVSGAERVYLAQLAHQLGLDAAAVARLESNTAAQIDAAEG
jgi:uncharacterized membrane protein YebE (DUF533 family)